MSKKRVYEIARELGVPSKELIQALAEMGMPGLKAVNLVDELLEAGSAKAREIARATLGEVRDAISI